MGLYWQDFFEYYDTDPATTFADREPASFDHVLQRKGEVTLADARHERKRTIERCVFRLPLGFGEEHRTIGNSEKEPRQGQFDNVHLAPRMRLAFEQDGHRVTLDDIVMAPFCIHDCLHMHSRWSAMHHDKHLLGFDGFTPHRVSGAPTVPRNQTIFASFPDRRTLRYRAVAEPATAGQWQCFLHHGFGYVIDVWPGLVNALLFRALDVAVDRAASLNSESYLDMPRDGDGWARLYWRLRFGGTFGRTAERLSFDLAECLR